MSGARCLLAVLSLGIYQASGEATWIHPVGRGSTGSSVPSSYPCGTEGENWSAPFTSLRVGRNTLTFAETVNHNGSPYRIALTYDADTHFEEFVLLDFIPHNDAGSTSEHSAGKRHSLDVMIPDVDCSTVNCALQLTHVLTDKMERCDVGGLPTSCGNAEFVSFSCANVHIAGTIAPSALPPVYTSYRANTAPEAYLPGESAVWMRQASGFWVLPSLRMPFPSIITEATKALIETFLEVPTPEGARAQLEELTKAPHYAGSPEQEAVAEYILSQYELFGIQAMREETDSLVDTPITRTVTLLGPERYECVLDEPAVPEDPTSDDPRLLPTTIGYGASGNVTGQLVYVNYGTRDDLEALVEMGVDLEGKILIARYGRIFRGVKVYGASLYGAAALLIYSDPIDDGFLRGDVFPEGPWRPQWGVQRGSGQYLNICPGDPRRTDVCLDGDYEFGHNYTGTLIPDIPVQPLSWGDAEYLLRAIGGPEADPEWQGGIPGLVYHIGPGEAEVNVYLNKELDVKQIINVIATIPGSTYPDQYVLIGNHIDAWTFGAVDPNSGTAALLEMAKGLSQLLATGWQPKRTIKLCSWDGEELALIGSVYHGETHAHELQKGAVAYINVDSASSGPVFGAGGTPSLTPLMSQLTALITDPLSGLPLDQAWDQDFGALGSGSDFAVFLHRLGIPVIDLGFKQPSGSYGVYHSIYDSFFWMDTFGDPTFQNHVAVAQLTGTIGIALADASVLPFSFQATASAFHEYIAHVQSIIPPEMTGVDLSGLTKEVDELAKAAALSDAAIATGLARRDADVDQDWEEDNELLRQAEQLLLDAGGLPKRPWYHHQMQAPGFWLGYGADLLPGVTEAIRDDKNASLANAQAGRVAAAIARLHARVDELPLDNAPNGTSPGAVAAVVIACLVLIGLIGLACFWCRRESQGSIVQPETPTYDAFDETPQPL